MSGEMTQNGQEYAATKVAGSVTDKTEKKEGGGPMETHPHQAWLDEIDAVRAWIVDNPDVPLKDRPRFNLWQSAGYVAPDEISEVRAEYAATAKALARTGQVEKTSDYEDKSYAEAGLKVMITDKSFYWWKVPRDSVCSKQKVVKEVEEWVCEPVLAGDSA